MPRPSREAIRAGFITNISNPKGIAVSRAYGQAKTGLDLIMGVVLIGLGVRLAVFG